MPTATKLARESATFLRETFLPRLTLAARTVPAADLWWSPHEGAISIGTILRHLEGNVRQWVLSGLAGAADDRQRAAEFEGEPAQDLNTLLERLSSTVHAAADHIASMTTEGFEAKYAIQGSDVSGVYAVMHVVEHFSWHTGQAVWIAKARAGADHGIAFYDEAAVNAARNRI